VEQWVPADQAPITTSQVSILLEGPWRVIRANGVAAHDTGLFPNRGNPHAIESQDYQLRVPAVGQIQSHTTQLGRYNFGIAVNGVPFDPGAAEWYLGKRNSQWQYEALSGAVPLGVDVSHAHVQPSGAYHYHGLPTLLLSQLAPHSSGHSALLGWAADGFPIYGLKGFDRSGKLVQMRPSYRLKAGSRPSGSGQPGGRYDGTFVADYEYVQGLGQLDECNGLETSTPEFPNGTYAYFLTEQWPVIPRCFRGEPSSDFKRQRPQSGHRHKH